VDKESDVVLELHETCNHRHICTVILGNYTKTRVLSNEYCPDMPYSVVMLRKTSLLLFRTKFCRYPTADTFEVIEKAILLLRFGADIKSLDEQTNNILYCILRADPSYRLGGIETQAETLIMAICNCDRCNASFRDPG
jgi:hypothetical protein